MLKKTTTKDLTCDVIIPLYIRDRYSVFKSLYSYRKEKNLVKKFILSYDNYLFHKNVLFELIILFFKIVFRYNIVVLRFKKRLYQAKVRQKASEKSTSDIIFYQDADDIVHPNRLSSIKKIFENNPDCYHLLHGYIYIDEEFQKCSTEIKKLNNLFEIYKNEDLLSKSKFFGNELGLYLALGVPVIRKIVIEKVKWKSSDERKLRKDLGERGEDHEFNVDCLLEFNKSYAFLSEPYRYMRNRK